MRDFHIPRFYAVSLRHTNCYTRFHTNIDEHRIQTLQSIPSPPPPRPPPPPPPLKSITTAPTYTRNLQSWPSLLQANTRTRASSDGTAEWLTRDDVVSKIVRHTRNRNPLMGKEYEPSYKTQSVIHRGRSKRWLDSTKNTEIGNMCNQKVMFSKFCCCLSLPKMNSLIIVANHVFQPFRNLGFH